MTELTLGFLSLGVLPAMRVLEAAAEGGFSAAGIRLTGRRVGDRDPAIVGNPSAIKELRDAVKSEGVRISSVTTYHIYPDVRVEDYLSVLETTATLGCSTIVAASYEVPDERLAEFFAAYADEASQFGIRLSIEFQPYSGIKNLAQANHLITLTDRPNVGLLIDALHLARSGGVPSDLAGIAPERFHFAQICDAAASTPAGMDLMAEARHGRLYAGDGSLPLQDFLKVLPADIELECESPVHADEGLPPSERARRIYQRTASYLASLGR